MGKAILVLIIPLFLLLIGGLFYYAYFPTPASISPIHSVENGTISLVSNFKYNSRISIRNACDGASISPPISIGNIPPETKTLALVVLDTDSPKQLIHWTIWNIPSNVTFIEEGQVPKGSIEGTNDFFGSGYAGPCPPQKETHTYQFIVYALNQSLNFSSDTPDGVVLNSIKELSIAHGVLQGKYSRN